MLHRDLVDFTAGLALGALVGAGLALALRRDGDGGMFERLVEAFRDGLPVTGS